MWTVVDQAAAAKPVTSRQVRKAALRAATLVGNYKFRQHQSHGLAVFLDGVGEQHHKVPLPLAEQAVVGPGFHIKLLLPVLAADDTFLVLPSPRAAQRRRLRPSLPKREPGRAQRAGPGRAGSFTLFTFCRSAGTDAADALPLAGPAMAGGHGPVPLDARRVAHRPAGHKNRVPGPRLTSPGGNGPQPEGTTPNVKESRMKLHRRVLAANVLAAPFLSRGARAGEFSLRFGHNFPSAHPFNVRATEAAGRIKGATKGQVVVDIFPDGQLGSDSDLLTQVRSGAVDMMSTGGLLLSTLVRVASLSGMGFAFSGYDSIWPAMDGELGALIRDGFAKAGLHALRMWDNGFRQVTASTRPIARLEDLRGFRLRLPPSPAYVSLFRALGASPTTVNLGETFSALQTHICDGQENPLPLIDALKFFEVQKYVSLTCHMWDGAWPLVNGDTWSSLPAELQAVLAREFDASALDERADVARVNAAITASLAGRGLVVNTPDAAPFRARLSEAGFYADWKAQHGAAAWAVLEKYAGTLA